MALARHVILAFALIGLATSTSLGAEKSDAKSFLRCGGWACSLTAEEVHGPDTKEAWALGRTTKEDAEEDCSANEGAELARCVSEQAARPPLVITADCAEGTSAVSGGEDYKVSAKAKRGELPHAQDPAFWENEMSHRARTTVITWLNLLCPKTSAAWHVRTLADVSRLDQREGNPFGETLAHLAHKERTKQVKRMLS